MDWSIEFKYGNGGWPMHRFYENLRHKDYGFKTITIWRFQIEFYWDKEPDDK